jgi:hypothetical protein
MAKITIGKVNPVARPSGGAMPNNNGKPIPPSGRKPNPMKPGLYGTAKPPMKPHLYGTAKPGNVGTPTRNMGGIIGLGGKKVNPTYNTYP